MQGENLGVRKVLALPGANIYMALGKCPVGWYTGTAYRVLGDKRKEG